jgi:muramoyltetrapeptide carboxypeptidase
VTAPSRVVQVVVPASPVDPAVLSAGAAVLAGLGLSVALPETASAGAISEQPPWLAGTDTARRAAYGRALASDAVAVWLARGGFGSARLLAAPGPALPSVRPPLVAFSDGTALLAEAFSRGAPAWSGPPLSQLSRLDGPSRARLPAFVAGLGTPRPPAPAPFPGLEDLAEGPQPAVGTGTPRSIRAARGPLFPANLTVLASLLGTPLAPDLAGCILALEDTGEAPYRVDRLLTQLAQSGALAGVRGLVLGDFLHGHARPDAVSAHLGLLFRQFAAEFAAPRGLPIAAGLPFGHGAVNAPLPCGAGSGLLATLETADGRASLSFTEAP